MAKAKIDQVEKVKNYIKENFGAKKNSAKKTAENFDKLTKAFVGTKPPAKKKEPAQDYTLVDGPTKISLTGFILAVFGFDVIDDNTFEQNGITLRMEETDKFYYIDASGKKKRIATVKQMKKLFTDNGKPEPETLDI